MSSLPTHAFKICGSCRFHWETPEVFLADPGVRLLGLQAVPNVPAASALVFEHACGSSISVLTNRLHHLVPEHPAAEWPSLRETDQCAKHCFLLSDHAPCDRRCRNSRDRDLLQIVMKMVETRA